MPLPLLPIAVGFFALAGGSVIARSLPTRAFGKQSEASKIKSEAQSYRTPTVMGTEHFIFRPPPQAVYPIAPECDGGMGGLFEKPVCVKSAKACTDPNDPDAFRTDCSPFDEFPYVSPYPFVLADDFMGVDVSGQRWIKTIDWHQDPRTVGWIWFTPSDGEKDLGDYIEEYVPIVLEAAAIYVATYFGGPLAGMAVKTAIVAIKSIVKGAPITKVMIDAAANGFDYIEKTEFGKAYNQFATNKYTRDQVASLRNSILGSYTEETATDVAKAIDQGIAIGRAKRVQELTLIQLKARLPAAHREWPKTCLDLNATLRDWAFFYGGNRSDDLLSRIICLATEYVEGGEVGDFLPGVVGPDPVHVAPRPTIPTISLHNLVKPNLGF